MLASLFKIAKNEVVGTFFLRDFSKEANRIAAMKNAHILHSRREFLKAAAFLLLADNKEAAIQVLVKNHHDPQLALFLSILLEGDDSPIYHSILNTHLKQVATYTGDSFLQAIIAWCNQDYLVSLQALLRPFVPDSLPCGEVSIDRYFKDIHSNCDCLRYPSGARDHSTELFGPFACDEALPLAVSMIHSPFYRFDVNLFRPLLGHLVSRTIRELYDRGYLDVLFGVLGGETMSHLRRLDVSIESLPDSVRGVLSTASLAWVESYQQVSFDNPQHSSDNPQYSTSDNPQHSIPNNPQHATSDNPQYSTPNNPIPPLSISPSSWAQYLNAEIQSEYMSTLSIQTMASQNESLFLADTVPTFEKVLLRSNRSLLRSLIMEPLASGRRSRLCSSVPTSWLTLLREKEQKRLSTSTASILERPESDSVTKQAILAAVLIAWETKDDHLLTLLLPELSSSAPHQYQAILEAIAASRVSLECSLPAHGSRLQSRRLSLPEWCLLFCRLLMYHNVVHFLNQVEWQSSSHLLSQWEQSLHRLLLLSTPHYMASDFSQMESLREQTCGFDNAAIVEFLRVYADSEASPFSGVSAQTLWQLTSCRESLAAILQSCKQTLPLLRWNESSVSWCSTGFEFSATREGKGSLRIVAPSDPSFPWYCSPQLQSLLPLPVQPQAEIPPAIDVLAPALHQPLLFFGSHSGASVSVGLLDVLSQRCQVGSFFANEL